MESEIGRELRDLFDEIAPPVDGRRIARAREQRRHARPGWRIGLAAGLVVLIAGAVTLALRPDSPTDATPVTDSTSIPSIADGSADETSGTDDEPSPAVTEDPTASAEAQLIEPLFVNCSAELDGFSCQSLIDGSLESEWQTINGGIGAQMSFAFDPSIRITEVGFTNLPQDERFMRNAHIKGVEVDVNDLPQTSIGALADENTATQWIAVDSINTSVLTITVTSAYPGIGVADLEPFTELALAEVSFRGFEVTPGTISDSLTTLPYLILDVEGREFNGGSDAFTSCHEAARIGLRRGSSYSTDRFLTVQFGVSTVMPWCGEPIPNSPSDLGPPADAPDVVDHGLIPVMGTQGRVIQDMGSVFSIYWIVSDGMIASITIYPTPDEELTLQDAITTVDGIVELTAGQWAELVNAGQGDTGATTEGVGADSGNAGTLPYLGLDLPGWQFVSAGESQTFCSDQADPMPGETRQAIYTHEGDDAPASLFTRRVNVNVSPASTRCSFQSIPNSASDLGPPAAPPNVLDHGMTTVMGQTARIVEEQGNFRVMRLTGTDGSVASIDVFAGSTPLTVDDVLSIAAGIVQLTENEWTVLINNSPTTPAVTIP